MKPFQTPNWNRSVTVLKVRHYSSFVKSVKKSKEYYIAYMLCDRNMNIHAEMIFFLFLFVCKIFLNDFSCLIRYFS